MSTILDVIHGAMKCVKCGAAYRQCDCWVKCAHGYMHETKGKCGCTDSCSCGWRHAPGIPCFNPETNSCTSRVHYGKYNRKTKRYE